MGPTMADGKRATADAAARRSLADAILLAYAELVEPNLPDDVPDEFRVPLLVRFRLGDLRRLKRMIERMDAIANDVAILNPGRETK